MTIVSAGTPRKQILGKLGNVFFGDGNDHDVTVADRFRDGCRASARFGGEALQRLRPARVCDGHIVSDGAKAPSKRRTNIAGTDNPNLHCCALTTETVS